MKRMPLKSLVLSVGMTLVGMSPGAGTIYVDCNLSDYAGHDGSSWEKALKTIQEGVDKAAADDTVLVQPGRYDGARAALVAVNFTPDPVTARFRLPDGTERSLPLKGRDIRVVNVPCPHSAP